MGYSSSGSNPTVITQSGTDNARDVSGGGVSSLLGNGDTDDTDLFIRVLNNARVRVQGTINLDAFRTLWVFQGTSDPGSGHGLITIENNGTLNINGAQTRTVNSVDYSWYSGRTWMLTQAERTAGDNRWGVEVESGGTFNWEGGEANVKFRFIARDGSTVMLRNAVMDANFNEALNNAHQPQWRLDSSGVDIDGLQLRNGWLTWIEIPAQFRGYSPRQCPGALKFSSGLPDQDFVIENYDHSESNYGVEVGSTQSFGLWSGSRPVFQNPLKGSLLRAGKNQASSNTNYGLARAYQEVRPFIVDGQGNGINDACIGFRDSTGGITTIYNDEGFSANPWNNADTNVYYEPITNGLVAGEIINVLTAAIAVDTSMPGRFNDADDNGVYKDWSRRGISPPVPAEGVEPDDLFEFYVAAYHQISSSFQIELKGEKGRDPNGGDTTIALDRPLIDDPFISESNAVTVAAYSTVTDLNNVYDWLKIQKTLSSVLFEYLGFGTSFAVESGGLLAIASGIDIVVDSSANINLNTASDTFTVNSIAPSSNFSGVAIASSQTIRFDDPSDVVGTGRSAGDILIAVNGVYDFSAWSFDSGSEVLLSGAATAATIYVAVSQQGNVTPGAGVTIEAPPSTITFNDCPLNTEIRVFSLDVPGAAGNVTGEIGGIENTSISTNVIPYSGAYDLRIVILRLDSEYINIHQSVVGQDLSFSVEGLLRNDRIYDNP